MTHESKYHTRHPNKEITDRSELFRIVLEQKFITLALCHDGQPYLVTVNHAFGEAPDRFYFHCSSKGRKADCLRANPKVYGQALEDNGYMAGQCDHAFRSVQFEGTARFVEDENEKRDALLMLIDQQEPDPDPVKERFSKKGNFTAVGVVRIDVTGWSGKQNS